MNGLMILRGCWLSKICSIGFVLLIVSPMTAPFQTVDAGGLFGRPARQVVGSATNASLVPSAGETTVSTVPPVDGTEGRLKLESRSASDFRTAAMSRLPAVGPCFAAASPLRAPQRLVLRL